MLPKETKEPFRTILLDTSSMKIAVSCQQRTKTHAKGVSLGKVPLWSNSFGNRHEFGHFMGKKRLDQTASFIIECIQEFHLVILSQLNEPNFVVAKEAENLLPPWTYGSSRIITVKAARGFPYVRESATSTLTP